MLCDRGLLMLQCQGLTGARVRIAIACFIQAALVLGCAERGHTVPGSPERDAGVDASRREPTAGSRSAPTATIIAEPDDEAAYIYAQSELRSYELILTPEALAQIDANPAAEEYVEGMLRFEGRDYGPLGIRYKGSMVPFATA